MCMCIKHQRERVALLVVTGMRFFIQNCVSGFSEYKRHISSSYLLNPA